MFISIEGIEGTGKTTVAAELTKRLQLHGISVINSREPGGTDIAERIRKVLLETFVNEVIDPKVELMLMFAARLQHVEAKIKPAIAMGNWIICDRFVDASYAYQGAGRKINKKVIQDLQQWTIADFMPDKTILLDMDPINAFERVSLRNNARDRIEQETISFFDSVRREYLERARLEPNRFIVINANQNLEQVMELIWSQVQTWI